MGKLEKMKEEYNQISIPEELNVRIQHEIQKSQKKQEEKNRRNNKYRFKKVIRGMGAAQLPVIVFEKYEIAPGSSGEIEFEIGGETQEQADQTVQKTEIFEDNFSVPNETVKKYAEKIFTEKLVETVKMADIENLNPSMAGFFISNGGRTNINFGVVDGALAINGMNYE